MRTHTSWLGRLTLLALAFGFVALPGDQLGAQEPKDPAKPADDAKRPDAAPKYRWLKADLRVKSDLRKYVIRYLRQNSPLSREALKRFNRYYTHFGLMRLVDKKYLENINDVRREFQRDMRDAKPGAFEHLNNIALRVLPSIIKNAQFHPVSRYNATLILGDLNLKKGGKGKAAIPLPKVLPFLVGDVVMNPRQIDAVRVAAMIGMKRHAASMRKFDVAALAAGRALMITAMLKVAKTDKVPASRTPGGHAWMRRQAVEILGELGDVGPGGKIAKALAVVAAEKDSPLWLRCAAAQSLGRLKLTIANAADVKPDVVAKILHELAVDVCKSELERATTEKLAVSQQQLLADLGCIQTALKGDPEGGLVALAPKKAEVVDLVKKFEALYTSVENSRGGVSLNTQLARELSNLIAVDKPVPAVDVVPKPRPDVDPKPPGPKPPGPKPPVELDFGE